jgi:hypothetical protein
MNNLEKKKYLILNNLFDKTFVNKLEELFLSNYFPYYYFENTVKKEFLKNDNKISKFKINDYLQFSHIFFNYNNKKQTSEINSDYFQIIYDILNKVKEKLNFINDIKIIRAKINLQTQFKNNKKDVINTPHFDFKNIPHIVIIYYVNNSDGKTYLFKKNGNVLVGVSPKKGDVLIFDGNILHAGSNPLKSEKRLLINIDIKK